MKCAALKFFNIQHFPANFMISSCFFPFKCCILLFIEGLKMSFYHILVCDAVFVTFVEEKKKDNKLLEFMNAETEEISFFTHKIFFAFGFIYDEGSEMCSAFYDEEDAKKFPNTSIPSFFLEKKGLSYKNFLNYWLFISSAFYVWEFLRKAVYWGKFMS